MLHLIVAEVPPVPPPAWAALATFLALVVLCFAYAMAQLADKICRALFGAADSVVGWIPWLGGKVKGPIHKVEARLTGYLDDAVSGLEGEIGVTWHRLARLVDHIGSLLWRVSLTLWKHAQAISILTGLWPLYKALRLAVVGIAKLVHASKHLIHDLTRTLHGAQTFVTHVVYPKVKVVANAATVALPGEIGRIGAKEKALEREFQGLRKREKALLRLLGLAAFTGLLLRALTKLRLGWLRCSNVDKAARNVCGMDSGLLDSLIADTLLIVGTISLVEFAEAMLDVEDVLGQTVQHFWRADV